MRKILKMRGGGQSINLLIIGEDLRVMLSTNCLLENLTSFNSKDDFESVIKSCFYILHTFPSKLKLRLPEILIIENSYKVLAEYQVESKFDSSEKLSDHYLRWLRVKLIAIDRSDSLRLDGRHLLSALDGLLLARKNKHDNLKITSSCVYSIIHIISSVASRLWINRYTSSYLAWESKVDFPYEEFYLNKKECIQLIKDEWKVVAEWFLNNQSTIYLSDAVIKKIQSDYEIWKKNELLLFY